VNARLASIPLFLLLTLTACDYLPVGFTDIAEVSANPAAFEGRDVKIRGKVADVTKIPLIDIATYTLEDGTGSLVVLGPPELPKMGERIAIRGRVESLVILAGQGFGTTLREVARLPIPDILMR
jgi:hypothetical protein